MATITYRTSDEKRDRLAILAAENNMSLNKTIDEMVTIALTERDSYIRFSARASRGQGKIEEAREILLRGN